MEERTEAVPLVRDDVPDVARRTRARAGEQAA